MQGPNTFSMMGSLEVGYHAVWLDLSTKNPAWIGCCTLRLHPAESALEYAFHGRTRGVNSLSERICSSHRIGYQEAERISEWLYDNVNIEVGLREAA